MMPTPVMYQGGRINVFELVPENLRSNELDVLYVTERSASGHSDKRKYGNGMGKELRFGEATIQFGDDNMTWPQLVDASLAQNRKQSIGLKLLRAKEMGIFPKDAKFDDPSAPLPLDEKAFADEINNQLANVVQPEVSIYVHGFKIDFQEGVAVGAELKHFLGRRQVVITYAWPCRQGLIDYPADVGRAEASAPNLARLIEFVATHTKAQHINVLGYSAGGTLVVDGFQALRERHKDLDDAAVRERFRVGNIVLAAADVDLKTFVKEQLESMTDVAQFVEITVSKNDGALSMAQKMHRVSRLGRPNIKELSREQIDQLARETKLYAVDVTDVKGPQNEGGGMAGHGYWYANPWVSSDILTTLIWQLPPDRRGLTRVPGKYVWTFPKDYPDRVHTFVTEQVKLLRDKSVTSQPATMSTSTEVP